jgi:hypothetical protein
MPDQVKKNLLGREVKTSSYSGMGLQGTRKTVTNRKGEVVRSENKLSNGSKSSMRKGLMGRKIEKSQSADGSSSRKVTSRSGNTREVKNTTQRAQDYEKTRFTPDSVKKRQVLKNNSLAKEKATAIKDGKKTTTDTRKFSYGKDSVTQKQTYKTKGKATKRYVDRMEVGGKSGKAPVSTSTKRSTNAVKQGMMYRKEKNK